jgi:hypothetical protein
MEYKRIKREMEVYIQGANVIIYEYYSSGFIEKLLEHAKKEYGIIFDKKCRGICG